MEARPRAPLSAALLALPLLAGWAGACEERGGRDPFPDDSVYVQVMARLTFIDQRGVPGVAAETPGWADSARAAVLKEYDLRPEELERYARNHGGDPAHMEAVWARIADLLDRMLVRAARGENPLAPEAPEPVVDPEGGGGDRGGDANGPASGQAEGRER